MSRNVLSVAFLLLIAILTLPVSARGQSFELTVSAPPSLEDVAVRVRALDPSSIARALVRGGLELPPVVSVSIVDTNDPRHRDVPPWVAARAFGVDTIVIYPRHVGSYPYDSLPSVVLHELVHLALNVRAGGRPLPRWFHEGVAVSVESGWGIGSRARLLLAAARDPGIDDVSSLFASEAAPETQTAYLLSAALIEDVRRRHGLAVPGVIAGRVAAGAPFESAFYAATGESVDTAARHAWRVYRGLRWIPVLTSHAGLWGGIMLLAVIAFVVRVRRRRRKRWDDEGADPLLDEDER